MITKAEAILGKIQALPSDEQRELWQELGRRLGAFTATAPLERYGEPLTDEDIEQSARVAFQMLDEEEKRAESRMVRPPASARAAQNNRALNMG